MELTKEEIKKIASLSKLSFTDQELSKFEKEFNNILGYISMIKECDTAGIEFEHYLSDYHTTPLQVDKSRLGLSREKALLNATDNRTRNGYIRTSKIISKE